MIEVKYDDIGMYILRKYVYICEMPIKMKVITFNSHGISWTVLPGPTVQRFDPPGSW